MGTEVFTHPKAVLAIKYAVGLTQNEPIMIGGGRGRVEISIRSYHFHLC